jgi:hypothetical protein
MLDVESYGVDQTRFRRNMMLVTALFVLFLIVVYVLSALPFQPNLANPYDMDTWPTVEAQQMEQLNTYGVFQVDPVTGRVIPPEEITEDMETVTRYRMPLEEARQQLLEQGLPTAPQ